ncbi:uncharacterized protein LOC127073444 [Lathyrus oleraceus]|uniref:Uncharacterized protein n=1 Tax=Pisum sativum TaxID=3888 RepID=A0A9D5ARR4_PEA|nr:uncharacterized protein LOC127073444 [Pisum sativum]KAI5416015.1 hypothetical protein KIW84_041167 [Pisum sativum]
MWKTKKVTCSVTLLTDWVFQHFPRIFSWVSVETYIEDMPRATVFYPLRGNQVTESFKVYLDYLVSEDMHFNNYVDHRQMQSFDEIVLYSRWLAYGSHITAPHLPERVMRRFGYTHIIPRHHVVYAHSTLTCRQIDDMFDDYDSLLIPKEAHNIIAVNDWSYVEGYIRWFSRVSNLYMVHAAPGDPHRSAHQEIPKEEKTQLNHVKDVFPRCCRIIEIAHACIDRAIFSDGSDLRQVLDAIMTKAYGTLI